MKKLNSLSEASIKKATEDYLTIQQAQGKLIYLRLNSGDFIEVRGKTRRRIRGCAPGTADFEIILFEPMPVKFEGKTVEAGLLRVIFLELKSATGKQSDDQKKFEKLVDSMGCEYHLARSVDEVISIIGG